MGGSYGLSLWSSSAMVRCKSKKMPLLLGGKSVLLPNNWHKLYGCADEDAVAVPQVADGLSADDLEALASEGHVYTLSELKLEGKMLVGYRTYMVSAALVGLGIAKAFGFPIPEEVWMMLGGIGLGTLRAAVEK